MENDSVADQMNRALFLAPDEIDEDEEDPLLAQAEENVEDEALEEDAPEARRGRAEGRSDG